MNRIIFIFCLLVVQTGIDSGAIAKDATWEQELQKQKALAELARAGQELRRQGAEIEIAIAKQDKENAEQTMQYMIVLALIGWVVCAGFAAHLGEQRNATGRGLCLGILFGPLGMIAAGLLDGRPNCSQCGGRQNVKPKGERYEVCEHCGCDNLQPPLQPQRQSSATSDVENDPEWEHSLGTAKRQLEQAGLIGDK